MKNHSCLFAAIFLLAFWWNGDVPAQAQVPAPAVPADPNQARPALPVEPAVPAPAIPAAATATNAAGASAPAVSVAVLADSSLRNVLQELAQTWADNQPSGPQMPLTLTNAGTMRTQIESNPAWDVVISPDIAGIKAMTDKGLLLPEGQRSLARNTLVIYGRKALLKDEDLDWFDLVGTEWKKVAMGNPDLVTSGQVAKRALQKHGLFDDDHKSVYVFAGTEALALQVAERDQADAVFLYRTDLAGANLPGFELFPINTDDAPPILYIAAIGRLAKNPAGAHAFIDYCDSEAAREIWAKYGFEMN